MNKIHSTNGMGATSLGSSSPIPAPPPAPLDNGKVGFSKDPYLGKLQFPIEENTSISARKY